MKVTVNKGIFIYLWVIGYLLIQVFNPINVNSLVSLGTWLIILSTITNLCWEVFLEKKKNLYFIYSIILVMIIVLSIIVSERFSYQAIVVTFSFLEIPFFISGRNNATQKEKNIIYGIFVFIGIYYCVLSRLPLAHIYETNYGPKVVQELVLGYNNPNEAAMHLIVCVIVLMSLFMRVRLNKVKIVFKTLLGVEILFISFLVLKTISRATIVTLVFLYIMVVVSCRKDNKQVPLKMVKFIMMIPLIFIVMTRIFPTVMGNQLLLGETMETGRYEIYGRVFDNMNFGNFIIGDFDFMFGNLHNGIVSVFGTIGIFGVLLFFIIFYGKILNIFKKLTYKKENVVAAIGLMCVILLTTAEAALITAGGAFFVEVASIFLLSEE